MHLHFQRITMRNFLGFGNAPTVIDLESHKLTSICAPNGSGKSAMVIDSLFFALSGEVERKIKKDQIVNSINTKQCFVKVELLADGKQMEIIRGISPDAFDVFIEGEEVWTDLNKPQRQKKLEAYLNIDSKTLRSLLIIASKDDNFMTMDGPTRRAFVERMLNLSKFDDIHREVKEDVKLIKKQISEKMVEYNGKKSTLDRLISVRDAQSSDFDEADVTKLEERITTGSDVLEKLRVRGGELKKDANEKADAVLKCEQEIADTKRDIARVEAQIKKSEGGVCHACGQDLPHGDNSHLEDELAGLRTELDARKSALDDANALYEPAAKALSEITQKYDAAKTRIEALKTEKADLERKRPSDIIDNQILEVSVEFDEIQTEKFDLDEKMADAVELDTVLKSGSAKAPVISEYMPYFNVKVNEYLEALGLPVTIKLDAAFNEVVEGRFKDNYSYESFSTGQKKRIDYAFLLTWRDITSKLASVSSNLLIIDEFGDKLDEVGVASVATVLANLEGGNTFCLMPKPIHAEFDRKLRVDVVSGFSIVKEEK